MTPFTVMMASAGTGKTFRLTNHYLALVVRGFRTNESFDPASILATTFTRKAAGEIIERVFSRLLNAATQPDELKTLQTFVDGAITADECERIVASLARNLHRINIVTIDALLARMAGSIAMEIGLPVGWRIVDQATDARMRDEAVAQVVRETDEQQLATLLQLVYAGGFGRGVHDTITSQVNGGFDVHLRSGGDTSLWWRGGEPLPKPDIESTVRRLALLPIPPALSEPVSSMLERFKAGNYKTALSGVLATAALAGQGTFRRKVIDPQILQILQPLALFAVARFAADLAGRNVAASELIARFDAVYTGLKHASAALRFDDLPRGLLARPLDDLLPTLYFRMDSTVRHLLLDEFQDTSVDQFRVLEPMIDEMVAHRDTDRTVFVVGDEKQSLYAWRGGKSRLLAALPERWPAFTVSSMSQSQRSSPIVLAAVNAVFHQDTLVAALGKDDPCRAAAAAFGTSFQPHTSAKPLRKGEVSLVQVRALAEADAPKPTPSEHFEEVIAEAVQRVRQIVDAAPHAEVAILTPTNKPIANIIYQLKQHGISASGEGGTPVTDAPVVAAAMAALELAVHPGDSASFAFLAASPLAPLFGIQCGLVTRCTDRRAAARRVSQALRLRLGTDGIAGTLRWLQAASTPHTDRRGFQRSEQLLDLADRFESDGGTDAADFADTVASTLLEDATPMRVRVMTVHKAKGLEFDAVILVGLQKCWNVKHDAVLMSGDTTPETAGPLDPVTIVSLCPGKEAREGAPELQKLHDAARFENVSAQLSALYVAMTRAKHALHIVIGPLPQSGDSLRADKLLVAALAEDAQTDSEEPRCELHITGSIDDWATPENPAHPAPTRTPTIATPPLALAAPASAGQRLQLKAPSSMEGGSARTLAEVLKIEPQRGRNRGTILHAMFEQVGWANLGLPDDATLLHAAQQAAADGPTNIPNTQLLADFRSSLGPATRAALSQSRYANRPGTPELRREYPIAAKLTDGTETSIIRGTIDRLVIGVQNGRPIWAEILDFKTDNVHPDQPAEFEARIAHYKPQMDAYIRTIAATLRLQPTDIQASLLFVASDRVIEASEAR